MDTIGIDSFPKQPMCDVITVIKNVGTGSPDSRSRIEQVVSAILNNLSHSVPSDNFNFLSSLRTLQVLLQVCVNSDINGNEFNSELAVKTQEISFTFLQNNVVKLDVTAHTLCSIVNLSLVLMSSEDLYKTSSTVISKCEEVLSVFLNSDIQQTLNIDPQIAVQLLCSVLSALSVRDVRYESWSVHSCLEHHGEITHELVTRLCLCKNDALRSQALIVLVPKILKQEGKNVILKRLLDVIFKSERKESLNRALGALTALCSYYLPDTDSNVMLSVEEMNAFWCLVQEGLCSDCPLSRKHALFLIRRCISSLVSRRKKVNCDMFFWDPNKEKLHFEWWEEICIILEVLEERAFHLVGPDLHRLDSKFIWSCKGFVPKCSVTWCLTVFRRLLQHPCIYVVKWGVTSLISYSRCDVISSKHDRIYHQFFIDTLIHSLNSPQIYYETVNELEHNEEINELLEKYFVSATKSEMRKELFMTLFDVMGSFNWAPIPLFIFTKSLMKVPSFKCVNPDEIPIMKRLVSRISATQNISIRSVCLQHLLITVINLINSDNFDLKAVLDLLTAFYIDGNLPRKSELWNQIVAWISQTFNENLVVSWLSKDPTNWDYFPPAFAQLITLLYDAGLLKNLSSLENLFSLLSDCDTRLYIDQEAQTRCVELVAQLLRLSYVAKVCEKPPFDRTWEAALYTVKARANNVSMLLTKRLLCVDNLAAYHIASRLFECFENFCQYADAVVIISKEKAFNSLLSAAFDIVDSDLLEKKVNFAFAMKTIKSCCENEGLLSSIQLSERRHKLLKKILLSNVLVEAPFAQTSKLPQWTVELLGPLSSSVLEVQWEFVALSLSESFPVNIAVSLLEAVAVGLDSGSRNLLPILLKVLRKVIARHPQLDSCAIVSRHCWSNILEVRHKDIFYPALREFLSAILQSDFVRTSRGGNFVSECGKELLSLGESAINVVAELAFALQILVHRSPKVILQDPLRSLVVSCFVMSAVQRRDEKLLRRIFSTITYNEDPNSTIQLLRDDPYAFVRCTAVKIFLFVISRDEGWATKIADLLANDLLKQAKLPEARRERYFSNSLTHRINLHILQGLMLVEPKTSPKKKVAIGGWVLRRLLKENHQLSVRCLTEWLLVRILSSFEHFRTELLRLLQTNNIRESSLCSVICTLLHFSQSLQVEVNKAEHVGNLLSQFFEALLPLTMSQAYSVRFNAHVAVLRVWETMEKLQLAQYIDLYKVSAWAVQMSFTRGSNKFEKHLDFYLRKFNCVEHYSLETLFCDIPRLTDMSKDECLEVHLLRNTGISETSPVPLTNKDSQLRDFVPERKVNRRSEASNVAAQSNCVQKKMVPSKWLEMNDDSVRFLPKVLQPWTMEIEDFSCGGLVVVASLLDKASNLGGLSRTCEIMGASLVLPKMSFVSDREFEALSMSSEMWVPLSEVKPDKLPEFLTEMKKRGFKLVGAEQTAKSTPLNSVQFDENTVLLLGNEVQGIPSNLLPLLDVCVEIPQFGLVRSLNVHVAGALFMYEYRRQHTNVTLNRRL